MRLLYLKYLLIISTSVSGLSQEKIHFNVIDQHSKEPQIHAPIIYSFEQDSCIKLKYDDQWVGYIHQNSKTDTLFLVEQVEYQSQIVINKPDQNQAIELIPIPTHISLGSTGIYRTNELSRATSECIQSSFFPLDGEWIKEIDINTFELLVIREDSIMKYTLRDEMLIKGELFRFQKLRHKLVGYPITKIEIESSNNEFNSTKIEIPLEQLDIHSKSNSNEYEWKFYRYRSQTKWHSNLNDFYLNNKMLLKNIFK